MVVMATSVVREKIYQNITWISSYHSRMLWKGYRKIWKTYLEWYISALGMEYPKTNPCQDHESLPTRSCEGTDTEQRQSICICNVDFILNRIVTLWNFTIIFDWLLSSLHSPGHEEVAEVFTFLFHFHLYIIQLVLFVQNHLGEIRKYPTMSSQYEPRTHSYCAALLWVAIRSILVILREHRPNNSSRPWERTKLLIHCAAL